VRILSAALVGGSVSSATGGKFASGAVTAAFMWAFSSAARGAGRSRLSVGDEPENVSDRVSVNRRFRDNIRVSCIQDECDMMMNFTIGGDNLVTDETIRYAARDISRSFSGGYVYGTRVYSVTTHVSIVTSDPDILVTAVVPVSNDYPGGQAFVGRGNVLELGIYGSGTAAHELGHLLGFRHQWNHTASFMSYAHNSAMTGRDIDRLARAYGPKR
jgi:predicted Zn-dependent protease